MEGNRSKFLQGMIAGVVLVILANVFATSVVPVLFKENQVLSQEVSKKKIDEIHNYINNFYVEDYDENELEEGMYMGYVYGLGDRYSSYMDKETFNKFMEQTSGIYAGIGAVVSDSDDGRVLVISPYDGSPAAKAGILAGDIITEVNGLDIRNAGVDSVVAMMKGKEGTKVNLTVYRKTDNSLFDVELTREKITVPTVSYEMLPDSMGYIRISGFEGVTYDQFKHALEDLKSQNMNGLIIDVRNNPGGILEEVAKISDELVPEGIIVYTEDKNGNKEYRNSDSQYLDIPLVLLVNGNSASASEVLAGAIKDYGVGAIVGEQTFGKGVVQSLYPLKDGSAIKLTTARYYSPKGISIHGEGVTPDYVVPMNQELSNRAGSLEFDEDLQLQKAVELLKQ